MIEYSELISDNMCVCVCMNALIGGLNTTAKFTNRINSSNIRLFHEQTNQSFHLTLGANNIKKSQIHHIPHRKTNDYQ